MKLVPIITSLFLTAQAALGCDADLDPIDHALRSDAPLTLERATCQQSLELSGTTKDTCYWTYDYRAPEAEAAFARWSDALLTCFGANHAQLRDQQVNHPDSYTLHRFDAGTAQISLSLKDKAGLSQTLVFIQITPKS